jgi:hypothetical protein
MYEHVPTMYQRLSVCLHGLPHVLKDGCVSACV